MMVADTCAHVHPATEAWLARSPPPVSTAILSYSILGRGLSVNGNSVYAGRYFVGLKAIVSLLHLNTGQHGATIYVCFRTA